MGFDVGFSVGFNVGDAVGNCVGSAVGVGVGAAVASGLQDAEKKPALSAAGFRSLIAMWASVAPALASCCAKPAASIALSLWVVESFSSFITALPA